MSYTKREWATGNVVGAVDLNRMEQGIEDAEEILVVNSTYNENDDLFTLNKTWQEIYDAFPNVIIITPDSYKLLITEIGGDLEYEIKTMSMDHIYTANSANDYPTTVEQK